MWKFRNERDAWNKAESCGFCFGFCVFDGFYYVGTRFQLEKIGCLYIKHPHPEND